MCLHLVFLIPTPQPCPHSELRCYPSRLWLMSWLSHQPIKYVTLLLVPSLGRSFGLDFILVRQHAHSMALGAKTTAAWSSASSMEGCLLLNPLLCLQFLQQALGGRHKGPTWLRRKGKQGLASWPWNGPIPQQGGLQWRESFLFKATE